MREAAEDEPGVSAVPRGGGSVEAETRIAISWSIIASRSAVKAAVPGPRSGSLSRQGATAVQALRSRVSPRRPRIKGLEYIVG